MTFIPWQRIRRDSCGSVPRTDSIVSTVIRSAEYAAGFSDKDIADMQKWVNENNQKRGYMNEPRG